MTLRIKLTDYKKIDIIENLVKSAKDLKKDYEILIEQPEAKHKKLRMAYDLNQKQIEFLTKYLSERNKQ